MTLPDYHGGSLVNLMSTIAAHFGGSPSLYPPLRLMPADALSSGSQVVLIVLDGLGYHYLQRARDVGVLNAHLAGSMTSVFPSTTATAVTAYLTGVPAQQHALTGWHIYLEEIGQAAAILPFETRGSATPLQTLGASTQTMFDYPTFFESITAECFALSPDSIANSPFNRAHTRGAKTVPYRSLTQFFENIERLTRKPEGPRYVYAYYPDYDSTAHEYGVAGLPTLNVLRRFADGFERLLRVLQGRGVTVLVSADHGFIDAPTARRIELEDHPQLARCLSQPLCGERRLAYCYVKTGMQTQFLNYLNEHLRHALTAIPSTDLLAQGRFGLGAPHPKLARRIGDFVLQMHEGYTIKDWLPGEQRHTLVGVHGGVTPEEMLVPLIVAHS